MRKPTYSYLKGLAENRAELSAEGRRLERLRNELDDQLGRAREELDSTDCLLRRSAPDFNPNDIAPIFRRGRYGKRGEFTEYVSSVLALASPDALKTSEVGVMVQKQYKLDFHTEAEAARWVHNSLQRILKNLVLRGSADRIPLNPEVPKGPPGGAPGPRANGTPVGCRRAKDQGIAGNTHVPGAHELWQFHPANSEST